VRISENPPSRHFGDGSLVTLGPRTLVVKLAKAKLIH
jgi:hypothetical protein